MQPAPQTQLQPATSAPEGTPVRQISVFLENRVGALLALVKLLGDHQIAVLGLSMQETTELALVRLILSSPEDAQVVCIEKGIAHAVTTVTAVELQETSTSLSQVLATLLSAEVNVAFSYPLLVRPSDRPVLILRLDSPDFAHKVLSKSGFKVLMQEDLSR